MSERYKTFTEFYPFYLSQHQDSTCRGLHYFGSILVILLAICSVLTQSYYLLFLLPLVGYGFAWIGHYAFEKNRPATFSYPFYSFLADWVMFAQFVRCILKFEK